MNYRLSTLFYRWALWMRARDSYKHVARDGQPYMDRYYLLRLRLPATRWWRARNFALFMHCFYRSDSDYLHDHPWAWGRLILSRGYWETHQDGEQHWRRPLSFTWKRDAQVMHRIDLRPGDEGWVWTLFWHFTRERRWGFLERDGSYRLARDVGAEDPRKMTGWLFPRKVDDETVGE